MPLSGALNLSISGAFLYDMRNGMPPTDYTTYPFSTSLFGAAQTAYTGNAAQSGAHFADIGGNQVIASGTGGDKNIALVNPSDWTQQIITNGPGIENSAGWENYNGVALHSSGFVGASISYPYLYLINPQTLQVEYNTLNSTPTVKNSGRLFSTSNGLYLLGGTVSSNGYGNDANTLYKLTGVFSEGSYTPAQPPGWVSPWTAVAAPPDAISVPSGCVSYDGSQIHVFGYTNGAGTVIHAHMYYDTNTDTWHNPGTTTEHNIGSYGNYIPMPNGDFITSFQLSTTQNGVSFFRTGDGVIGRPVLNTSNVGIPIPALINGKVYAGTNTQLWIFNPYLVYGANY